MGLTAGMFCFFILQPRKLNHVFYFNLCVFSFDNINVKSVCIFILTVDGTKVVLREWFITLNPVRVSSAMVDVKDRGVPFHLPSPDSQVEQVMCNKIVVVIFF